LQEAHVGYVALGSQLLSRCEHWRGNIDGYYFVGMGGEGECRVACSRGNVHNLLLAAKRCCFDDPIQVWAL
jgi:hypothetical protein